MSSRDRGQRSSGSATREFGEASGFRRSNGQTDHNPEVQNLPGFPEKALVIFVILAAFCLRSLTCDACQIKRRKRRKQRNLPVNNPNDRQEIGLKTRAHELAVTYAVAPGWEP